MINHKSKKKASEKNNKQVLGETLLTDDSPELSLTEKLREKKRIQKKKNTKRTLWGLGLVFFVAFLYWGFMPFQGTIPYSLCKILVEQNISFPETLQFNEVSELRTGDIRIWFTHIDAFGAFRQESFVCSIAQDEETGQFKFSRVKWGAVDLDQKQVERFNKIMPFLVKGNYYDTSYPAPLPDSVADMKLETDRFRKVNIMDLIMKKK